MKKSLVVVILLFFVFSFQAFAVESEAWLVNGNGERTTEIKRLVVGDNLDLGKVRLREDNYTIGKLREGDRILLVLRNASFTEAPLVLDPIPSPVNPIGSSGEFELKMISGTGGKGQNAVIYQLERKTRFYGTYRNLDYVFHLNNIKVEKPSDVSLEIYSFTDQVTSRGNIIRHEDIKLGSFYNITQETIVKNDYINHEIISRELNQKLENMSAYNFTEKNMKFEVPKAFFEKGDMLGTLRDERWTFRVLVKDIDNMKVNNPVFSEEIGTPIRQIEFYKIDGFSGYSDVLAKNNFEPIKVTFSNLNPSSLETTKFVPIKYVENEDGTFNKILAGSGMYDNLNKSFSFLVNGPGIYSVEKKEAVNITMRVNDFFASVNNIQTRLDSAPQVINGFTYVPVRFIAENLGAEVEFLQSTNQVQIKTNEKTIFLPIDKITTELTTPARIIEGRTMVPVRYVSEQLGAIVTYFADTKAIEIIK